MRGKGKKGRRRRLVSRPRPRVPRPRESPGKVMERLLKEREQAQDLRAKVNEQLAKHPDGFFGFDAKLLLGGVLGMFGGVAGQVGTQLLVEHVVERMPELVKPKPHPLPLLPPWLPDLPQCTGEPEPEKKARKARRGKKQ